MAPSSNFLSFTMSNMITLPLGNPFCRKLLVPLHPYLIWFFSDIPVKRRSFVSVVDDRQKKLYGFAVRMVWKESSNHFDDCYFCLTNSKVYLKKKIEYPIKTSTLRSVPHGEGLPESIPPLNSNDNIILDVSDIEDTSDENIEISQKT
ncbi:hypothetical protein AVEN_50717-1 [Araneus ventricosus]|uniref:Uncharacterized protein n=1 Tax=Araneus ventricosus TaxID=182803 RepID=A0A4Y2HY53_ARAVE|nr:hypothetical protein AVEN_50717-1 [Araneus ventricosus]